MVELPEFFASQDRALVITPAGCGKTELIARAVAYEDCGRQLILTHTHAGVKSLCDRLRRFGVSTRLYQIDTIAGFALKYGASFPQSSGLGEFVPSEQEWDQVYEAGRVIVSGSAGRKVISSTYSGLYVDEYQDCTQIQHELIMALAEILPCRIVGDPLQGIFDFGDNELVDWFQDILPNFERLPDIKKPWRWVDQNEALGDWLLEVRDCLFRGTPVDLRAAPAGVTWARPTLQNQINLCFDCTSGHKDSVVAVHKWANEAHALAQKLNGAYTSMEEVESKDLLNWSAKLENSAGSVRALSVIGFASICMTRVSSELRTIKRKLEANDLDFSRISKHIDIALALKSVATSADLAPVLDALALIESLPGSVLYRRELWQDMKRSIDEYERGGHDTLKDAAWWVRDRGRIWGRRVDRRIVSRVLLIKGLEFDHSIVLNADRLEAKELYVAMTRGSRSLRVLASKPIIQKEPPFDFSSWRESRVQE
jgi:DNA helicase-2/ATP-dependent DNA helicase PcrA